MLNALLDVNQIESGTVHAEIANFAISDLVEQLRDEFTYHAQAKGLSFRVVPCGLSVSSDPRLLEQMLRNLVSNALKYTSQGNVLLGCRRHGGMLSIEVWDTGVGIPEEALEAIFEEYHQLDNAARERSRGLGRGLSIVHHLGALLGHPIHVQSRPGKGSLFSVDVPLQADGPVARQSAAPVREAGTDRIHHTGAVPVIEDAPDVRELLEVLLTDDGHVVTSASDGVTALDLVKRGVVKPDLILADFNLPTGMDGVRATVMLREALHRPVPAIILTGDISTPTLRDIALEDCQRLSKPMKLKELTAAIQRLLPLSHVPVPTRAPHLPDAPGEAGPPVIFVVDDDDGIREAVRRSNRGSGDEGGRFGFHRKTDQPEGTARQH